MIAKMDGMKNEVDGLYIQEFPTLLWYSRNNKTAEKYDGQRSLKVLKSWVNGQVSGISSTSSSSASKLSDAPEESSNVDDSHDSSEL